MIHNVSMGPDKLVLLHSVRSGDERSDADMHHASIHGLYIRSPSPTQRSPLPRAG